MAALPATPSDTAEKLQAAIARRFGSTARVENLTQATLGGSNRTLLFDVVQAATRRRLVSREETFTGPLNPFLPPAAQFQIMSRVFRAGLRVPEPMFEYEPADALGPGFVTAFAAGESLPRRLLADTAMHAALVPQLAGELARLHALPAQDFAFLAALPESGDPIAKLRGRIDALGEPHPALEAGLRWLERHPNPARPRGLAHGDFRTGNFLVHNGALTALLDWECSHLSVPAADIGWFCTRSWRFGRIAQHAGGLATRAAFLAAYQHAGGTAPAEAEIRWWEIFGLIRWAMYNMLQAHGHVHGRASPAYALCGRNVALMEYNLLMTLSGDFD